MSPRKARIPQERQHWIKKLCESLDVVHFPTDERTDIRKPKNFRPGDEFRQARMRGNALSGDGFYEGDIAIIRLTNGLREITPGRLVAIKTPVGLLCGHIYIENNTVRLSFSDPDYKDLFFALEQVEITGVIIRLERDLE
jgi:SOS-response transcriptional repressor LexA